ncbi:hypothetical protein Tco_1068433 [Tanacetum coccineum]|uniref:Uncharacterized protein n=1 Tax=Tanacetum coccineum TaxID=301880 RepID=A0ABQ5HFQ1_9ASTR
MSCRGQCRDVDVTGKTLPSRVRVDEAGYSSRMKYGKAILDTDMANKSRGPYILTSVTILAVPAVDDSLEVPAREAVETILNMFPKNKDHFQSEKEAIHLLLTRIGDEIYSTVSACKTTHDMWIAIKRLQQAKNANLLELVAAIQQYPDPYYQAPKPQRSFAPTLKQSSSSRSHTSTKYKGNEIAKPITPLSESASSEDNNQTCQFGNQRKMTVAGDRETVGSQVLMCKQAEIGVPSQAEQADLLEDTDEEVDEQELEAHYSFMVQYDDEYNVFANERQHSDQPESINNTCIMDKVDSSVIHDSPDMCNNENQDDQNAVECDDERVALANLIANLKLDIDENKKDSKAIKERKRMTDSRINRTELEKYKAFNDRTIDYDKLELKLNETLGLLAQKENDIKEGLVKEKTKVITDLKLKEEKDIDKMISIEKQLKFLNEIVYKRNQSIQTIHMLAPKGSTFNGRPTFANPMYHKKAQSKKLSLYEIPYDTSDLADIFALDKEETMTLEKEKLVDQAWVKHTHDSFCAPTAHDMEVLIKTCLMPLSLKTQNDSFKFVPESDKADFSNMYDLLLQECVSKDVMCSYLHSLSDSDAHTKLQCLYLNKVKECECLA